MKKMRTSWKKDVLARSSIRITVTLNATERFAAAAGHFLIGAANRTRERAQCNDDHTTGAVASRFVFSAVTEADYTFVTKAGWPK